MSANPQAAVVELTPRRCRWCGRRYVAPKHSRPAGCPRCAPTIEDAIRAAERAAAADGGRDGSGPDEAA